MGFYIAMTLRVPFDAAIDKIMSALKEEGLGVLTEIDVRSTLKAKLGAAWRPHWILGACPRQAAGRFGAILRSGHHAPGAN
jgi:uncharacterized protein (DUF302 family)